MRGRARSLLPSRAIRCQAPQPTTRVALPAVPTQAQASLGSLALPALKCHATRRVAGRASPCLPGVTTPAVRRLSAPSLTLRSQRFHANHASPGPQCLSARSVATPCRPRPPAPRVPSHRGHVGRAHPIATERATPCQPIDAVTSPTTPSPPCRPRPTYRAAHCLAGLSPRCAVDPLHASRSQACVSDPGQALRLLPWAAQHRRAYQASPALPRLPSRQFVALPAKRAPGSAAPWGSVVGEPLIK